MTELIYVVNQLNELTGLVKEIAARLPARYLSVKEYALEMGVSQKTVRRMIARNEIVYRKTGRTYRVCMTETGKN